MLQTLTPHRATVSALRLRVGQSAFWQEKQSDVYQRSRRAGKGRFNLQPAGLLGHHEQQAAQLCAAHRGHAEGNRSRGVAYKQGAV